MIWKRTSAHHSAQRYGPVHDVLRFYTKSDQSTWNLQGVNPDGREGKNTDLIESGIRRGETGQPWRGIGVMAWQRDWMYPLSELERLDAEGLIHWPAKSGRMPR